jgi:hypothetical protein
MVGFATLAVVLAAGGIFAAWQARTPPTGGAWDDIDVGAIG